MKKFHKKSLVLLIVLALLLTCTVSGTVAFLAVDSDPVTNTFTPVKLDTKIVETFTKGVKSSVKVQNNGNIDAYVRVGVYGYWAVKDAAGNEKIVAPWTANFTVGDDWVKTGDWYYYTQKLSPNGEMTGDLLASSITQTGVPSNYPNAYLVVNVIHQAIQTTPSQALDDANWGWKPN